MLADRRAGLFGTDCSYLSRGAIGCLLSFTFLGIQLSDYETLSIICRSRVHVLFSLSR